MLADQLDYVVGVDSHRDVHALAVVEVRDGCGGVRDDASLLTAAATRRRFGSRSDMRLGGVRSRSRAPPPTALA